MKWKISFTKYAQKDYEELDNSQKILVNKALRKVSTNPLPETKGGYGKPLKGSLKDYLKIKLVSSGIRIVYCLIVNKNEMEIIVIGMRKDEEVYNAAEKRITVVKK